MGINQPNRSLTIHNSPIEFVVVGPKGKRNGVLIRSENLKTDLIGFAATGRESDDFSLSSLSWLFSLYFFLPSRRMYSVGSSPIRAIKYDIDKRNSEYRFCWVGMCSGSDRKSIHDTFNRYIEDLLPGIQEGDIEQVEWSISPVILRCSEANTRMKKQKLQYQAIFGVYFTIIMLVLLR